MLIAALIIGVLAIACIVAAFVSYDGEAWGIAGFVLVVIALFTLLLGIKFELGSQNLTGYIYSSENRFGYTTAHIRFSENAGTDEQPSFCVASDSEAGKKIQELVGSGKKVKVDIPSYFYFTNNIFACGTTNMTIKEVK